MSETYTLLLSARGQSPRNIPLSQEEMTAVARVDAALGSWDRFQGKHSWVARTSLTFKNPVDHKEVVSSLRAFYAQHTMDVNLVPTQATEFTPALILMDVDSTAIQQETIDELGKRLGVGEKIAKITEKAMLGEASFAKSLEERVAYLRGMTKADISNICSVLKPQDGLQDLIAWAHNQGMHVACVSGGFTLIVEQLSTYFGFDSYCANELEFSGDRCTGKVIPPIITGEEKKNFLLKLCHQLEISPHEAVCIGDGANDIDMIRAARVGIGFNPKPTLEAEVAIVLKHSGLDAIIGMFNLTAC